MSVKEAIIQMSETDVEYSTVVVSDGVSQVHVVPYEDTDTYHIVENGPIPRDVLVSLAFGIIEALGTDEEKESVDNGW